MSNIVKSGDTHSITLTVNDSAGSPVDLTGSTIRLLARINDDSAAMVELTSALGAGTGEVTHTLTGTLPVGTYNVEVEATIGGVTTTAPTEGYATLVVTQDLG